MSPRHAAGLAAVAALTAAVSAVAGSAWAGQVFAQPASVPGSAAQVQSVSVQQVPLDSVAARLPPTVFVAAFTGPDSGTADSPTRPRGWVGPGALTGRAIPP